jgi:hypothetical protein
MTMRLECAWGIRMHGARWVGQNMHGDRDHRRGFRPFVWTRDIAAAEKYGSANDAAEHATALIGPEGWEVQPIAPILTSPPGGGTPVSARLA